MNLHSLPEEENKTIEKEEEQQQQPESQDTETTTPKEPRNEKEEKEEEEETSQETDLKTSQTAVDDEKMISSPSDSQIVVDADSVEIKSDSSASSTSNMSNKGQLGDKLELSQKTEDSACSALWNLDLGRRFFSSNSPTLLLSHHPRRRLGKSFRSLRQEQAVWRRRRGGDHCQIRKRRERRRGRRV